MKFQTHSHRFADLVLQQDENKSTYDELIEAISSISDADIAEHFKSMTRVGKKNNVRRLHYPVSNDRMI